MYHPIRPFTEFVSQQATNNYDVWYLHHILDGSDKNLNSINNKNVTMLEYSGGSLLSLRSDKGLGGARSGFGSTTASFGTAEGGLASRRNRRRQAGVGEWASYCVSAEIQGVDRWGLRKPKALGVATDLLKTREALLVEQVVISKKIEEFPHGIRSFPVDIEYVTCDSEGYSSVVAPYVSNIVRMVLGIHNIQRDRTILAFLTSQIEVEWALSAQPTKPLSSPTDQLQHPKLSTFEAEATCLMASPHSYQTGVNKSSLASQDSLESAACLGGKSPGLGKFHVKIDIQPALHERPLVVRHSFVVYCLGLVCESRKIIKLPLELGVFPLLYHEDDIPSNGIRLQVPVPEKMRTTRLLSKQTAKQN
nr:hypothetical protein DM860_014086 [Ipomoea trifida]